MLSLSEVSIMVISFNYITVVMEYELLIYLYKFHDVTKLKIT